MLRLLLFFVVFRRDGSNRNPPSRPMFVEAPDPEVVVVGGLGGGFFFPYIKSPWAEISPLSSKADPSTGTCVCDPTSSNILYSPLPSEKHGNVKGTCVMELLSCPPGRDLTGTGR